MASRQHYVQDGMVHHIQYLLILFVEARPRRLTALAIAVAVGALLSLNAANTVSSAFAQTASLPATVLLFGSHRPYFDMFRSLCPDGNARKELLYLAHPRFDSWSRCLWWRIRPAQAKRKHLF